VIAIRDAEESDFEQVARIYGFYVRHSTSTFEEEPPTAEELSDRWRRVLVEGLPYIVAVQDGAVAGYAYAGAYRPRAAYRFTIEDSVYVSPDRRGNGVGRALLTELIARCEAGPRRQMVAVIGDSGNEASMRLHARLGFEHVGTLKGVGFKFGRWVDSVLMQRALTPFGNDAG
jgi:L-amino acid N-acyltransferase YncA